MKAMIAPGNPSRRGPFFTLLLVGALAVSACESEDDRVAFDGLYFRSKVSRLDDSRAMFTVNVRDAGRSVIAAQQAGAYEAASYCLNKGYGTSRIRWVVGPDQPPGQVVLEDGELVLQGECNP